MNNHNIKLFLLILIILIVFIYLITDKYTKKYTKKYNIVIGGCARNCGKYLPRIFKNTKNN